MNTLAKSFDLLGRAIDWYEERAAIREYDGGLSREDAEREVMAVGLQRVSPAVPPPRS